MTVLKDGFCLNCGKTGKVEMPSLTYLPVPSELPGWCTAPLCQEAKKNFDKVIDVILSSTS